MDQPAPVPPSVVISHVADFYRRYPGETVTFYTRIEILRPLPSLTFWIDLPPEVTPGEYKASGALADVSPRLEVGDDTREMTWRFEREIPAGARFDYELQTTINHVERDLEMECRAGVALGVGDEARDIAVASVTIDLHAKGRYLQYLPGIYRDDDLMGRFVMLFESFWSPIEGQIDNLPYYFDPEMAPSQLLPWLAAWVDLVLDERWPEEKRRRLLKSAVSLYRKRGTRKGLQEFLEIYTGVHPQITERRARNFRVSKTTDAVLGSGVALGKDNQPHTFAVTLHLPPLASEKQEADRRKAIEAIITAEKPAHTGFSLNVETRAEEREKI
jgi:phage tail-like protein